MNVFVSIGSNLGDRLQSLAEAYRQIGLYAVKVENYSSVYETEPWGFEAEKNFLNQVIEFDTHLEPSELMQVLLQIEAMMGRTGERGLGKFQSRTLDIDILFVGDRIISDDNVKIPHPRLHLRKFVLAPMAEIAPLKVHPVLGISMITLLNNCIDQGKIVKVYSRKKIKEIYKTLNTD
jgi:2-amino-4-hydroxy-6-hydroxymethyldihydropteridine diphosphokinase